MAEKISTIIIHLDLDCCTCHEKITKILCKFHCIQTKTIDYKQKTLTISGPFDPDRLMKCLSCKAGKYIKSYEIVKEKSQPPKDQQQKKKNDGEVDKPDKQQKKKQDGEVTKPDQPKPIQVVVPIQLYVPVPKPIPVPAVLWPFYGRPCCDGHREGPCRWLREPTKPLIELVEDSDPAPPLALPPPEAKPTRPASPPPTKPAGTRPVCCRPCNEGYNDGPCRTGHWPQENFQPGRRTCCTSCYEGYGGGPCWQGEPSGPTSICYKSQYQGTDTGVQVVNEEDPSCNIM